jgi:hypothetical protein
MNMTTSSLTAPATNKASKAVTAPRAGAIAGILFALLFGISVIVIRISVPANSADASAWTTSTLNRATLALRLIPFACIFFLWFVGVIRDRLGGAEDKLFATVTLGSGLVFVSLTLASCALAEGLLESLLAGGIQALPNNIYLWVRSSIDLSFNTYAVKMSSVFMLSLGTLWRRTRVMPGSLVYFTYLLALVMLFAVRQSLWLLLLFPIWVLLVSVYILITNLRRKEVSA